MHMPGGDFWKNRLCASFLQKAEISCVLNSHSLGHLFSAFPSNLVQMRKSLLRLTANTLPHFNSPRGSVLLIHTSWGEDTVGKALIITTAMFPFHGFQTHLIVHAVRLYVPCLPLSWLVITVGPSPQLWDFTRTVFLCLPYSLGAKWQTRWPFFQHYFRSYLYLDIPWNVNYPNPGFGPQHWHNTKRK